jgi:hypothetical protein
MLIPNLTETGDQLRTPDQLRRSPIATTAQTGAKSPESLIPAERYNSKKINI